MSIGNLGSYSSVDPFILVEDTLGVAGNNNTNGKTLYSGILSDALILLTAGQSNVANSFPTIYTPTNASVLNFNIYDGATYRAVDPLLGCSTVAPAGNFAGRLADKMINAGTATKIIIVPVAIDGTEISQWTSDTNFGNRITVALRRLAARGLTPTAILWGQGEGDPGTTQVNYQNALSTIISNSRTNGFTGPWFIARQTWLAGSVAPDVQAAQLAIVNHTLGIWAGPNADSLDNTYRQGGGTHFTDAGGGTYAGLWQTALHAYGAPF